MTPEQFTQLMAVLTKIQEYVHASGVLLIMIVFLQFVQSCSSK